MKKLLFLLVIINPMFLIAQENFDNEVWSDSIVKNQKTYWKNGNIKTQNMKTMNKEIRRVQYYDSGNIFLEVLVKQNYINDTITTLDPVTGKSYKTAPHTGRYNVTQGYVDTPYGYYREFFDNGEMMKEGQLLEDTKIGEWKTYYENGKIATIENYDDRGLKVGKYLEFYENGLSKIEGYYSIVYDTLRAVDPNTGQIIVIVVTDSKEDGTWIYYDSLGVMVDSKKIEK
jgi:antitoxin component YwqK of YwqJK toxin-antitoxin module